MRRVLMRYIIALLILCFTCAEQAIAEPWARPGDVRLRHDLQLLADNGLLNIPLTSWPVSWGDVSNALADGFTARDSDVWASWRRVDHRIRVEFRERVRVQQRLAASAKPIRFRTFTDTAREPLEEEVGVSWMGDSLAYRLQAAAVSNPSDGKKIRFDGSYLAAPLGNWILTAGWLDRWWGPGWDGSLILSNNARPVPALSIRRNHSDPFTWPVLNWLGPWQFTFFTGLMEGERVIPHALLTGMRLSFKPVPSLEIGLSRAMQWGGQGRPQNLATFSRALAGLDNARQRGITRANQPGNQLAGYDLRWSSNFFDVPFAFYTQWIGEDAKGFTPKRFLQQAGMETWGAFGKSGASYRLHVEYSNTTVVFWRNHPKFNIAYSHHIYRSGYRYYGRSLGHSVDGDGQMFSLGGLLIDDAGRTWEALFRSIRTNQDNISRGPVKIPAERILNLNLRGIIPVGRHQITLELGGNRRIMRGGGRSNDLHGGIQWRFVL